MFFRFIILISCFLIMGCEDSLLEQTSPPKELVGTWTSSEVSMNPKGCEEFDVDKDGVSVDMIKINEEGTFYATRKVKSIKNLFRKEGSVDRMGNVTIEKKFYKAYFEDAAEEALAQGYTFTPFIRINKVVMSAQKTNVEMKISATLSNGSMGYNQNFPSRYYQLTSGTQEDQILSKLTQCLDD